MKNIALSDDVYLELLHVKHRFEKEIGEVISYDKIVKKLIDLANGVK